MLGYAVKDWANAYANAPNIPEGDAWPDRWVAPAAAFREAQGTKARLDIAYGPGERETLDLFLPEDAPRGLVVFVHGGFWFRLDKSFFSHLAAGAVGRGWAVAMPSYPLCPTVRVRDITARIGAAIERAAAEVPGPIRLIGHSAGGHLVTRMICVDTPLSPATVARIAHVLSLSGVHDLRPLLRTPINDPVRLDAAEAAAESPVLKAPLPGVPVTCWVGAGERAEFLRQNALLANIWRGLGSWTAEVAEPDRHHFDVVDGLTRPGSPLTHALLREF